MQLIICRTLLLTVVRSKLHERGSSGTYMLAARSERLVLLCAGCCPVIARRLNR